MFDYPFPRDVYETDAQYLAQGYFLRHPEDIEAAAAELIAAHAFDAAVSEGYQHRNINTKEN